MPARYSWRVDSIPLPLTTGFPQSLLWVFFACCCQVQPASAVPCRRCQVHRSGWLSRVEGARFTDHCGCPVSKVPGSIGWRCHRSFARSQPRLSLAPATTCACSDRLLGTTWACSDRLLGTTWACSDRLLGTTCACSDRLLGTTWACSDRLLGTTCACSGRLPGT
jgi:hypothetical protein